MVTIPTVHLNGDTREELVKQNMAVYRAAGKLLEALGEAGPNGRNFYVQGPQAMKHATDEHVARLAAVEKIQREMEEIVLALQER